MENAFSKIISIKQLHRCIFGAMYLLLFIPYFYSMYYAVPASDDFAMTLGRDGYSSVFSELIACIQFFWTKRGGTIIGFIVEVLINPLNAHKHLGHIYGIYMIMAFLLCFFVIMYGVKTIVRYTIASSEKADLWADVITFLTAFMLLENYYYVETYNWYVGMIAYPFAMSCLFLTFAFIIKFSQTGAKKYYIGMIATGIIAANTTALDVPLGIFFLYIVFLKKGFTPHLKSIFKRYLLLLIYILVGVLTLAAPGNYARQSQYTETVSVLASIRLSVLDVSYFGALIIKTRPVTLIVMALLVLIGIALSTSLKHKPANIFLYAIAMLLVCTGCILPYVYGRGMSQTYLDVRMQYVLDYFIEIGICIGCVILGQWLGYLLKLDFRKRFKLMFTVVCVIGAAVLIVTGRVKNTITYEVINAHEDIKNSYNFWNGILTEIENSSDEVVVVNRDYSVPWNKYFLYSGMEPGVEYAVDLDTFYDSEYILPNVYYKKNSIIVNYPR